MIPVTRESQTQAQGEIMGGTRTAQDLYNDIEGQRNDVDINLPAIPEEMPGGTNETDEHV